MLSRLVRVQLIKEKGKDKKGKRAVHDQDRERQPAVLNGLALSGTSTEDQQKPSALAGISLPPRKNLTVPATAEVVDRLGLKRRRPRHGGRPQRAVRSA